MHWLTGGDQSKFDQANTRVSDSSSCFPQFSFPHKRRVKYSVSHPTLVAQGELPLESLLYMIRNLQLTPSPAPKSKLCYGSQFPPPQKICHHLQEASPFKMSA